MHLRHPTLEAIDFQRDGQLFKELTILISSLAGAETDSERQDILTDMGKIAFTRTGMNLTFNIVKGQLNAFVIPATSNSENPLNSPVLIREVQQPRIKSEQELFKGKVDLANSKVSGIYSELPLNIFIGDGFFKTHKQGNKEERFLPEEIAAIVLHEMGHAFTYFEFLGKFVITNLVIAEIISKTYEGADDATMQNIIKIVEQKTGYQLKDLGSTTNRQDPLIIQTLVLEQMVEQIKTELGTKYYDARAFEFSSDQFAARHGAGRYIVTGLDRMYRLFATGFGGVTAYMSTTTILLQNLWRIAKLLVSVSVVSASGSASAGGMVIGGLLKIGLNSAGGVARSILLGSAWATAVRFMGGGDIYDDIPHRYKAVRRELIAAIKNPDLPTETRKALLTDIDQIDEVIDNLQKIPDVVQVIQDYIAGAITGNDKQMKFMRRMEELANNRLFELAARLK